MLPTLRPKHGVNRVLRPPATGPRRLGARRLYYPVEVCRWNKFSEERHPLTVLGIFIFHDDTTTTLRAKVTFKLPCENPDPIISPDTTGNSSIIGYSRPFYASISPQIFALATATVISYILVILIFITPRTFYLGGGGGGGGRFLGRRGITTGSYGSSSAVGVGRRPLLQKIATITVAISLTIATADTFNVAETQYNQGFIDSSQLVDNVVDSLEVRIIRVISDTFLWLAQVQTLIRLFPRHKEKVTIKWLGFAMVSCDTIFSILDSFVNWRPATHPRSFSDAIPALNYLFELAISLIYASCVVYYCLSKRRFAFWHPRMKNICLVALLSLISVVIPVVFFILDIAQPDLAGWGEYIRWVGAAAASVVVWEWVERIESLERDERKDGILGREIFDGDEMLNMTPSEDASWRGNLSPDENGAAHRGLGDDMASHYRRLRMLLPLRKRRKRAPPDGIATGTDALDVAGQPISHAHFVVSPQIITSPNRSDTGSAASTVYAVRYHNVTGPSPNPQPELRPETERTAEAEAPKVSGDSASSPTDEDKELAIEAATRTTTTASQGRNIWHAVQNPFKRRRSEPPAEVAVAQSASGVRRSPIDRTQNLRDRFGAFASAQKDRFANRGNVDTVVLPVTVIPAPKNSDRTWSPDDFHGGLVEDQFGDVADAEPSRQGQGSAERQPGSGQVMFIPAPRNGRTWSPEDAHLQSDPGPAIQRPEAVALRQHLPSSGNFQGPQQVYTSRGSLTISESDARPSRVIDASHPGSPRPISYARPPGVAPIAEDDAHDTSSAVAAVSPGTEEDGDQTDSVASPRRSLPVFSPGVASQQEDHGSPINEVQQSDGRDSGGTEPG